VSTYSGAIASPSGMSSTNNHSMENECGRGLGGSFGREGGGIVERGAETPGTAAVRTPTGWDEAPATDTGGADDVTGAVAVMVVVVAAVAALAPPTMAEDGAEAACASETPGCACAEGGVGAAAVDVPGATSAPLASTATRTVRFTRCTLGGPELVIGPSRW